MLDKNDIPAKDWRTRMAHELFQVLENDFEPFN